jgi:drug/metabolite transporter (DMT)-like permease
MNSDRKHLGGAFLAMLFVGASWGANLPVTKVMLQYFDILPMSALRLVTACIVLTIVLLVLEGKRALRIDLGVVRFAQLGLLMSSFFLPSMRSASSSAILSRQRRSRSPVRWSPP